MVARLISTACLLLLLTVGGTPAADAQTAPDPQGFIQTLAQTAMQSVMDSKLSDAARADQFRRLFVSTFDLPEISRFVLGRFWKSATPPQQQAFLKLFEDFQVAHWSQLFKDHPGYRLNVSGASADGDNGWLVDSKLVREPGDSKLLQDPPPPVNVQWKVHLGDDGRLLVTDVKVEGISLALTQRQEYSSMLQGNGGNVDALMDAMRANMAQPMAAK